MASIGTACNVTIMMPFGSHLCITCMCKTQNGNRMSGGSAGNGGGGRCARHLTLVVCLCACVEAQATGRWTGHWISEFGSVYTGCNPQQEAIDRLALVQFLRACCVCNVLCVRGGIVRSLSEKRPLNLRSQFSASRSCGKILPARSLNALHENFKRCVTLEEA
eukprot:141167-Amphidinium_carterae.1